MKKIELTMKEQNIYQIIKKLVETNGNKTRAAIRIGCTVRNINLLIKKYNEFGKQAFSHGNKHRKPSKTISKEIRDKIVKLYEKEYHDFNWNHFLEFLNEKEGIQITYNPLHKILSEAGFISPLAFKRTRRKKAKELNKKKKLTTVDKKLILDGLILDRVDSHPRKPRAKYFGELIQMDASGMIWWDDEFSTLHIAVDDSTGEIVGAYFTQQETLNGYYNVLHQILSNYGIPNKFLTDKRTVFIYKQRNAQEIEHDTFTQFGYACSQLGIEIETTSIPEKKGRVERFNGTLQRRLPQELRKANIHNIEDANKFLISYVKRFNKRFSLLNNNSISVFEDKLSNSQIDKILAIVTPRKFDSGSALKFHNKYYLAVHGNESNIQCFRKGVEALIIQTFSGELFVSVEENLYSLIEVQENERISKDFDDLEPEKTRTIYTPPMTHPWKRASFLNYLSKTKNLEEIGANN